MTTTSSTTTATTAPCWCCGQDTPPANLLHLGSRPEVGVCLRCAHFLHHQASAREDAERPSLAGRARDVVRAGRRVVMEHGWQHAPVIGPVLRWLGPRLP